MADKGDKTGPFPGPEIDPDAPPSAEEIAASQRLRDALEDPSVPNEDAALSRALAAAYAPSRLTDEELEEIVLGSLSMDEARAAHRLRAVLAGEAPGGEQDDAVTLARALAAAWSPTSIDADAHRRIVEQTVATLATRQGGEVLVVRRRRPVVRVAFGAASVVALAASIALVVRGAGRGDAAEAPLAHSRSTQPLFSEPFKTGDASARIDKIAMARASDFRDNRFAKWGVR